MSPAPFSPRSLAVVLLLAVTLRCSRVESFASPSRSCFHQVATGPLRMTVEVVQAAEALQALPPVEASTAGFLSQLDAFWQTSPYTAAALICGFKGGAADMVAQQTSSNEKEETQEKNGQSPSYYLPFYTATGSSTSAAAAVLPTETTSPTSLLASALQELDVKRNLVFILYGALYQGMVHEYVFNTLYPAWFGTGSEVSVVAVKVLFNLLVQTTLVTLPVAYVLKAVIMGDATVDNANKSNTITISSTRSSTSNPLQSALDKYWADIQHQQLLQKCFGLWGPVQCITFSIVPEHYRVTFIAIVSFFWLIILSGISNTENE